MDDSYSDSSSGGACKACGFKPDKTDLGKYLSKINGRN